MLGQNTIVLFHMLASMLCEVQSVAMATIVVMAAMAAMAAM